MVKLKSEKTDLYRLSLKVFSFFSPLLQSTPELTPVLEQLHKEMTTQHPWPSCVVRPQQGPGVQLYTNNISIAMVTKVPGVFLSFSPP